MTQTPNIGLKKIDGSENWRNVFDYHNDSMDLADEAIAGVRAGLTYVENGDTIAANANYTAGKFIAWKGEIYRILTTINATVTSANWTTYLTKMDGIGGALSQINGDIASLNSNITGLFHVIDQLYSNVALNSSREANIGPMPTVTGYKYLMAYVRNASTNAGVLRYENTNQEGSGNGWICGDTASVTITNVTVRYIYVLNSLSLT